MKLKQNLSTSKERALELVETSIKFLKVIEAEISVQ